MLKRPIRRLLIAGCAMALLAGCDEPEPDPPQVRRGRGAPLADRDKANVSKFTYTVDQALSGEVLEPGRWFSGTLEEADPQLDDRTHYDVWALPGEAGERYTILLQSNDFDAFLMLAGGTGGDFALLAEDDDGGSGTNSRIVFTVPQNGPYAVLANSVFPGETGEYRIRVEREGSSSQRAETPIGRIAPEDERE